MELVIFAVTGAVGTEAKAQDFPCGSENMGASVRGWLAQPLPLPAFPAPYSSSSCCLLHLCLQASAPMSPPPRGPPQSNHFIFSRALTLSNICIWLFVSLIVLSGEQDAWGQGPLFSVPRRAWPTVIKTNIYRLHTELQACSKCSVGIISFNPHQSSPFYR